MFFLPGHLAILFNVQLYRIPQSGACWSKSSQELCEEVILTVGGQHEQDLKPDSFHLQPSALEIELDSSLSLILFEVCLCPRSRDGPLDRRWQLCNHVTSGTGHFSIEAFSASTVVGKKNESLNLSKRSVNSLCRVTLLASISAGPLENSDGFMTLVAIDHN